METTIKKIDEVTAEITTPQPAKVERLSLDNLMAQRSMLTAQLENTTNRLREVDTKIASLRDVGVKTRDEVQLEILQNKIMEEEPLPIEDEVV